MDPNNQNPQGGNDAVKKLEQDLQSIKKQEVVAQPAVPEIQPVQPATQVPEVPSVVPAQPTPQDAPAVSSAFMPESTKKGSPILIVAIILAVVAVLAVVAYVFGARLLNLGSNQKACTQEAKICPDGSSVGRTGPNCEFAACPTVVATPIETLIATASPSATPTVTPSASASAKPTSTPTSSPTATP
jgi:hypothetical protein